MCPTIRDGEAVTVEPVRAGAVKRGDILLYRAERGVIAHRVVRIEGEQSPVFTLRGDASETCDEPIEAAQILGRVVAVERGGRRHNLCGRRAVMRRAVRVHATKIKAFLKF